MTEILFVALWKHTKQGWILVQHHRPIGLCLFHQTFSSSSYTTLSLSETIKSTRTTKSPGWGRGDGLQRRTYANLRLINRGRGQLKRLKLSRMWLQWFVSREWIPNASTDRLSYTLVEEKKKNGISNGMLFLPPPFKLSADFFCHSRPQLMINKEESWPPWLWFKWLLLVTYLLALHMDNVWKDM